MATKKQLEQKLHECRLMNDELQQECRQIDVQLDEVKRKNDELSIANAHYEMTIKGMREQCAEASEKAAMIEVNLSNANKDLDYQKRRANELNQLLKHIASLCEHRSKVSHGVLLFECDADGNRLPVPEEVRFLREIHEICNDYEIPF